MKGFLLLVTFVLFFSTVYAQRRNCDDIPSLNVDIINTANKKANKKIGNGLASDLISATFKLLNIPFNEDLGRVSSPVNTDYYCVYPGDIVYVEELKIEQYVENQFIDTIVWRDHYAIVSEVLDESELLVIHQNCLPGAKVIVTKIKITPENRAKIKFFRAN